MNVNDFINDDYINVFYANKQWSAQVQSNFCTLIEAISEVLGEFDSWEGNPGIRVGLKEGSGKGKHLFHISLKPSNFGFGVSCRKLKDGLETLSLGTWAVDKTRPGQKNYFNWNGDDFQAELDNLVNFLKLNIGEVHSNGLAPVGRSGRLPSDYPDNKPGKQSYLDMFQSLFEDKKDINFTSSEIVDLMKDAYGSDVKPGSILPSDFTYNRWNSGLSKSSSTFKKRAIFFWDSKEDKYQYKGAGWNYSGQIVHSTAKSVVGEWQKGEIVAWFDNKNSAKQTMKDDVNNNKQTALNAIYYGPPGTGKTYYTIEAAVKAAEPDFYTGLENKELTEEDRRSQLKAKYEALVAEKRIRFVAFHQSYGYEEFVEGLKAESDDGKINYKIEPGVFKKICDDASISHMDIDSSINPNGRVWKISIEDTYSNVRKTYCLENNIAAIGWDATGDLSLDVQNEHFSLLGKNDQNSLKYFSQEMEKGDLVLCIDSNTSVEAIGVVCGDYRFVEEGLYSGQGYCHQLPVRWLAKDFSVDFQEINGNKRFNLPTCYPLNRLSVSDTLAHLEANNVALHSDKPQPERQNYVLIIDEINRGNISKIFGELITLIEPSKRKGKKEELEISLPHSKHKLFSVPDNLYIIGTMNTADRSLAMMDTALRRRFDFVEMMPKPELFEGVVVQGIDIETLLKTLNKRIEVLYDREHTLGHAFFMPVKAALESDGEEAAFTELQLVFKNKVLPLLEEYFYEDWSKISLVLGDNQKKNENLQFVRATEIEYSNLFGSGFQSDNYGQLENRYELALFSDGVWKKRQAYQAIYSPLLAINTTTSDEE
ncbi:AAA family ATPase [Vibrio sp. 10N.222.55.B11]|uniref:DUF7225 domain-containing protein n=1 Tax=Vibrio sp. 10N.222.55.B11 TaxID=3229648 RepID=UPI0035508F1E